MTSRRTFIQTVSASLGFFVYSLPVRAAGHGGDSFNDGKIGVHPIAHASVVFGTPAGTIYVDPVGDPGLYADMPPADLILVTHEHGDHFNGDTLTFLADDATPLLTNPAVFGKLPADLQTNALAMANGESHDWAGVNIAAIPAYNMHADRLNFHPQGRDNGYVLDFGDFRIYVSGDTEDIPEMRALQGIDLAFVSMNLPFTMDAEAAASAVREFRPKAVYPYHYRGRGDGTQDPAKFAELVGDASEVRFADWY